MSKMQIACHDVSLGYGGVPVVEGLDFQVAAGDYLCVVGPNGAGKSTLVKTLLGLQAPLAGEIVLAEGLKRRDIGYLAQQTPVQKDFPASVREIVLSGCQGRMGWRPFYSREEKDLAEAHMAEMGITELADRCYRDLSGGQQQRVLLARALCATRKLLLLDEPVSGLDPEAAEEMYTVIAGLNRSGVTILMITHDLRDAIPYATHVLHIGQELFWCTKEEYLAGDSAPGLQAKGGADRA